MARRSPTSPRARARSWTARRLGSSRRDVATASGSSAVPKDDATEPATPRAHASWPASARPRRPFSSSVPRAKARTTSSMRYRAGCASSTGSTSDVSTRRDSASAGSVDTRTAAPIASAVSRVTPPGKRASAPSRACSSSVSRRYDHSRVAFRLVWRAEPAARPPRSSMGARAMRACRSSTVKACSRPAASSMASGRPSRARTMPATAALPAGSRGTGRRPWRARSRKSRPPAEASTAATSPSSGGTSNGPMRTVTSAGRPSGSRLVVTTVSRRHASSREATRSRAACRTCSQLSSRTSHGSSPTRSAIMAPAGRSPTGWRPSAAAEASGTAAAVCTPASATTPVGRSAVLPTSSTASRVLPTPPTPVSVTSPGRAQHAVRSSRSRSRPTIGVTVAAGAGHGRSRQRIGAAGRWHRGEDAAFELGELGGRVEAGGVDEAAPVLVADTQGVRGSTRRRHRRHEQAMGAFPQGVERDRPHPGVDRSVVVAGGEHRRQHLVGELLVLLGERSGLGRERGQIAELGERIAAPQPDQRQRGRGARRRDPRRADGGRWASTRRGRAGRTPLRAGRGGSPRPTAPAGTRTGRGGSGAARHACGRRAVRPAAARRATGRR